MKTFHRRTALRLLALAAIATPSLGCLHVSWPSFYSVGGQSPAPQGTLSDPIWIAQEENAEPSKFVVYQHEFVYNNVRLNWAGEDHLKQIAARLHAGQNFPVLIERSVTSKLQTTEYKYPVHPNADLDMQRRAVVVQALAAMGIPDADQRVIVSPALVRPQSDSEAERSYARQQLYGNGGGGAFGGGFGGFGGGAGGGGFGS